MQVMKYDLFRLQVVLHSVMVMRNMVLGTSVAGRAARVTGRALYKIGFN